MLILGVRALDVDGSRQDDKAEILGRHEQICVHTTGIGSLLIRVEANPKMSGRTVKTPET